MRLCVLRVRADHWRQHVPGVIQRTLGCGEIELHRHGHAGARDENPRERQGSLAAVAIVLRQRARNGFCTHEVCARQRNLREACGTRIALDHRQSPQAFHDFEPHVQRGIGVLREIVEVLLALCGNVTAKRECAGHVLEPVIHIEQHVTRQLAHVVEALLRLCFRALGSHVEHSERRCRTHEQQHARGGGADGEPVSREEPACHIGPRRPVRMHGEAIEPTLDVFLECVDRSVTPGRIFGARALADGAQLR